MPTVLIACVALASVAAGVVAGRRLQRHVPTEHLRDDTRDVVKVASGMIATLTALVLGLLVGSAKSTWDSANQALVDQSARLVLLDRALARCGPEGADVRAFLRETAEGARARIWESADSAGSAGAYEAETGMEAVEDRVRLLDPADEGRRRARDRALAILGDMGVSRWTTISRAHAPLPVAFHVALDAWLFAFFASVSLIAPRNHTVTAALLACGLCVSSAIFLVVELNRPLDGWLRISDAPVANAIGHLGR